MDGIYKYPRTRHIQGSGTQAGDDDLQVAPSSELAGKYLVVEEKMDGANCGISFDRAGRLRLQSRGHYLAGGPRERQFELLKSWAARYTAELGHCSAIATCSTASGATASIASSIPICRTTCSSSISMTSRQHLPLD